MARILQLVIFVLVPIANYLLAFSDGSARFDDDPQIRNDPAGYAFAIWGPIFIGMIYYSYRMWRDLDDSPLVNKAAWAGISAGLASIAFVPISMTDMQWLVLVNILWHLVSLVFLYKYNHAMKTALPSFNRWNYLGPQMYLGWISAATTVSFALTLREIGVAFVPGIEVGITVALMITLGLVGSYLTKHRGTTIALVVIWALIGIMIKHGDITLIRYFAIAVIVGLVSTIITSFKQNLQFI